METLFSKNKSVKYLLCMLYIFTKHAQVKPLKDKKAKNVFIEIVNKSNHKPNKLRFDQGREFYHKLMK